MQGYDGGGNLTGGGEMHMVRVVVTTNGTDHWHPALLRAAKAEGAEDPHGWLVNDLAGEIRELVRDFVEKHSEAISVEPEVIVD